MASLVEDLQTKALDNGTTISDLLRIAMAVARKLDLSEMDELIHSELRGYGEDVVLPSYRVVPGQLKGRVGWNIEKPVAFEDGTHTTRIEVRQSVAELEKLVNGGDGRLTTPVGPTPDGKVFTFVELSRGSVHGILDRVRTIILDWALQLEKEGIVGDGLSFSPKEKVMAKESTSITNVFYGDVNQANLQQGNVGSQQVVTAVTADGLRDLAEMLREHLSDLELDENNQAELKTAIEAIETQAERPKIDRKAVGTTLERVKNILVAGAAAKTLLEPVLLMLSLL